MANQSYRMSVEAKGKGHLDIAIVPPIGVNAKADEVYSTLVNVKRLSAASYPETVDKIRGIVAPGNTVKYHVWSGDSFVHFDEIPDETKLDMMLSIPATDGRTETPSPVAEPQGDGEPKAEPAKSEGIQIRECLPLLRKALTEEQYIGYLRGRILHHQFLAGNDRDQMLVAGWYQTALEDVIGGAE